MKVDDQEVAEWFSLELARLYVDSRYRDVVVKRYESEKTTDTAKPPRSFWRKVDCLAVSRLMAGGEFRTFQELTIDFSNQCRNGWVFVF
jgi:hypothetical protein